MEKRLSKALAAAGIASRRASEELIFAGRVSVNGKVALLPQTMVQWDRDEIRVDGKLVSGEESKISYLLNKPVGYLCSNQPIKAGDRLVIELFPAEERRLFTVGRLDRDTTGLLIVTNDGDLANSIIHPSSNIEKEYVVTSAELIERAHILRLRKGALVEDCFVKPTQVRQLGKRRVSIVVKEGKKREVRRMAAAAGLTVDALQRIRIGGLNLPDLAVGAYRLLTDAERSLIFS